MPACMLLNALAFLTKFYDRTPDTRAEEAPLSRSYDTGVIWDGSSDLNRSR